MSVRPEIPAPTGIRAVRAAVRSLVPALAILGAVALLAVYVTRTTASTAPVPATWTASAGFERAGTVDLADATTVALWVGHVTTPKSGPCWYLVTTSSGAFVGSYGACGGPAEEPWLMRDATGFIAGGTGRDGVSWVELAGERIPVRHRHFITTVVVPGPATTMELIDEAGQPIGQVADLAIEGDP